MSVNTVRFPGESAEYRTARNALLRAEIDLRRRIEEVAALRRKLPAGGAVPVDYTFDESTEGGATKRIALSQLFQRDDASLVVYSFMYGPQMEDACPNCTSMLDSLDGAAPHITQRMNLVVVARSPIERIRAFARGRGWRNLRLLSSASNSYNRDYHAESENGSQLPVLNVFTRHGGVTRHAYASELAYAARDAGQDPRHIDSIWPIWSVFDFTPDGRGSDWRPRLRYAP